MRVPSGEFSARPESGRIPATIGPYRVQREIGRGAAGVVYAVTRDGSEGVFALKLIRDLEGLDQEGLVRFQREAELSSKFSHPGVVGALDAGAFGRHRYLVLPYVEGESLAGRLRRERALPPEEAALLAARVAEALATVHAAGVIHRDIKPDNILLDRHQGGAPRLTDFGIAREGHGRGSLTQSSAFLGTPAYMAPEQIEAASQVDGKADVYSLASVLYECLSGLPPFQGATFEVADQVLHSDPPRLEDVAPGVPSALARACHAALAKDSAERPDAASFARLITDALGEEEAAEASAAPKLLLAVALVVGLGVLGGWLAVRVAAPARTGAAAPASPEAPGATSAPSPAAPGLGELRARTHEAEPLDPELVASLRALSPDPAAALVLADYQVRRADLAGAEETLLQIPESAPEWRRAALERTRIMLRLGRNRETDALEADLLLSDLEDPVGRLVRARRLLGWRAPTAALEVLQPLLSAEPLDRIAVDLALLSRALPPGTARALLEKLPLEGDPELLIHQSALDAKESREAASRTLARAEALCAPSPFPPALVLRGRSMMRADGTVSSPEIHDLVRRCYEAEPSGTNLLLLLLYGKLPESQRESLSEELRREAPTHFAILSRSQPLGSPLSRPPEKLATPFFPGDESWTWARARVAELPERARRHGFRALTAAISGARGWDYVARELDLAQQFDETEAARQLAIEICVRRGRVTEALARAGDVAKIPPLLRAQLELYRGHEAAALDAYRDAPGRLARAAMALATGRPEEGQEKLRELETSVDLRLLRFEADFALEQKREAIAGRSLKPGERRLRAARGADEVARVPIRENLARIQAQIGSLDMRLGVAYGLLELANSFRPQGPRDPGHPENPIHRAVYFAGDANAPSVYFLRRGLFYITHQLPQRRRFTLIFWGSYMIPVITKALEGDPAPALDLYLGALQVMGGGKRLTRARAGDPLVELPEHLLPIVAGRADSALFVPEK